MCIIHVNHLIYLGNLLPPPPPPPASTIKNIDEPIYEAVIPREELPPVPEVIEAVQQPSHVSSSILENGHKLR